MNTSEMTLNMKIALLEDDHNLAEQAINTLSKAGYQCDHYGLGKDFLFSVTHHSYDLFIMDWQLPDIDGIDVLRQVRQQIDWPLPILFLTQRDSEEDIVAALNAGADDYMVKPARPAELLARLKALLRRNHQPSTETKEIRYGSFLINHKSRSIMLNGKPLSLTEKDFDLTAFLFENKGRLLSRAYLLERIWGISHEINTRTVDTHMSRLRRKLGVKPENGFRIRTIYQHGYRLEDA